MMSNIISNGCGVTGGLSGGTANERQAGLRRRVERRVCALVLPPGTLAVCVDCPGTWPTSRSACLAAALAFADALPSSSSSAKGSSRPQLARNRAAAGELPDLPPNMIKCDTNGLIDTLATCLRSQVQRERFTIQVIGRTSAIACRV